MATITEKVSARTGKVTYQAKIRMKGFKETQTFKTRTLAEKWVTVTEAEMILSKFVPKSDADTTTLFAALDRYAKTVTPDKKGKVRELQRIRRWQLDPLTQKTLTGLKRSDLTQWRDAQIAAGSSKSTVRKELMVLSAVYSKYSEDWGFETLSNPLKKVAPKLSDKNRRDRRFEDGEEALFFAALDASCRKPDVAAAVRFALATCARRGEIHNLTWDDIDLKHNTAAFRETKNGTARTIPLTSEAVDILKQMPRNRDAVFAVCLEAPTRAFTRSLRQARADYLLQCVEKGERPSPKFLTDMHLHDLRHEGTTRLFEDHGFGIMEAAAVTGHKTLALLQWYTHLRPKDLAKKMRKTEPAAE